MLSFYRSVNEPPPGWACQIRERERGCQKGSRVKIAGNLLNSHTHHDHPSIARCTNSLIWTHGAYGVASPLRRDCPSYFFYPFVISMGAVRVCVFAYVPRAAIVWVQRIAALLLRAVSPAKDHPSQTAIGSSSELWNVKTSFVACVLIAHTHTHPPSAVHGHSSTIYLALSRSQCFGPTERQEKGVDGLSDYTQYK